MSRVSFDLPDLCVGEESSALTAAYDALVAAGVEPGRLDAAILARGHANYPPASCVEAPEHECEHRHCGSGLLGCDPGPEPEHVHCKEEGCLPVNHCAACKDDACDGWDATS